MICLQFIFFVHLENENRYNNILTNTLSTYRLFMIVDPITMPNNKNLRKCKAYMKHLIFFYDYFHESLCLIGFIFSWITNLPRVL